MDERNLEQLAQPFKVSERRGVGNKVFKYVPSEDIVARMNKAFKGNWSTEVRESKTVEDQVLMCVRVYAQDPTDSDAELQWHDGYASHPLARYTSGPNNGKIIDIGNSYKSAMSKAIKTSVAKWGVALYLDQGYSAESNPSISTRTTGSSLPEVKTSDIPSMPPVKDPKPAISGPPIGGVSSGPPMTGPPTTGNPKKASGPSSSQPPVFTVENTETPVRNGGFDIPEGSVGDGEKLTSVQRVAIETIMSVNNLTFEEVLTKSLQRADNLPVSLEDISYLDAVTIIQYGNNLRQI